MLSDLRENVSDFLGTTVFMGVTSGGQKGLQVSSGSPLKWPIHRQNHEMGWPGSSGHSELEETIFLGFLILKVLCRRLPPCDHALPLASGQFLELGLARDT